MIDNEIQRVLTNPDHVIMSEELEIALGNDSPDGYLSLDDNLLMCELLSAKRNSKTSWELQLSVPGLTFQDFVSFEKAVFQFGDLTFLLTDEFEFVNDINKVINARAMRIFTTNE
tara:strand:+ start:130 stop:474 length:345 start_codon:yes stop_codon:yes gene_type:complete